MNKITLTVFAAALIATALSLAHVLSPADLAPQILFASALVLALMSVISGSDHKT